MRLPAERNSTRAGKRPLYLNDEEEHDVPEWEKAGSRQEEYRNKEDFDDDRFSEDQDSNQSDEAQQRLTSSIMIKKKARVPQAEPYEIKTDILGNEWFCVAGKEQSKSFEIFSMNTVSTLSSYLPFLYRNCVPFRYSI